MSLKMLTSFVSYFKNFTSPCEIRPIEYKDIFDIWILFLYNQRKVRYLYNTTTFSLSL